MKFFVSFLLFLSWANHKKSPERRVNDNHFSIIAKGSMPNLVTDKPGNVYLVYGLEDSIFYTESMDQGASFSKPALVATLPALFANAMRGPQIAITRGTVVILAADKAGNIFSYRKVNSRNWEKATRVNDVEAVAKEGLMALSGDGSTVFAVWLDLRGNKHNKIEGAKSSDGGKTWSINKLIYASPDSTVCECCKPSVAIKDNHIYVMFRNWIRGNRDLYITQSSDGADHFNNAQKLGNGHWPLNGCPMDGGGLTLDAGNNPQTVWRRQNKIFSCTPGKPEVEIGEGRSCSITSVNGMNLYAWCEDSDIVCLLPHSKKKVLGKGALPLIQAINNNKAICVWEDAGRVCKTVLDL